MSPMMNVVQAMPNPLIMIHNCTLAIYGMLRDTWVRLMECVRETTPKLVLESCFWLVMMCVTFSVVFSPIAVIAVSSSEMDGPSDANYLLNEGDPCRLRDCLYNVSSTELTYKDCLNVTEQRRQFEKHVCSAKKKRRGSCRKLESFCRAGSCADPPTALAVVGSVHLFMAACVCVCLVAPRVLVGVNVGNLVLGVSVMAVMLGTHQQRRLSQYGESCEDMYLETCPLSWRILLIYVPVQLVACMSVSCYVATGDRIPCMRQRKFNDWRDENEEMCCV